jgi:hypothetical protein
MVDHVRVPAPELTPDLVHARRRYLVSEINAHSSRRRILRLAVAPTLVAVAGAGIFVGLDATSGRQGNAYAATPAPLTYDKPAGDTRSAHEVLLDLARVSEAQPAPGPGVYRYSKTAGWSLFTRVDGQQVTSKVMVSTGERWSKITDDSGQNRMTTGGKTTITTVKPHERSQMFDVSKLSTDVHELARQLAVGHPTSIGAAERIVAVTDLWGEEVPPPKLRGAVLRVLANEKGFVFQGEVVDRAGRRGLAVGVDSAYSGLPTRYSLIFDPLTGRLLASEQMLTTRAGKLNVKIPSVIGYSMWLADGRVDQIGVAPR